MVVRFHDGQRTGAYKGRTARNTTTGGNIAIHEDLNAGGSKRRLLLAQKLQCSGQPRLKVVHPLVLLRVNLDIGIPRHGEFARRKLFRIHVRNLHGGLRARI